MVNVDKIGVIIILPFQMCKFELLVNMAPLHKGGWLLDTGGMVVNVWQYCSKVSHRVPSAKLTEGESHSLCLRKY